MKRRQSAVSSVLLLVLFSGTAAAQVNHPNLLFNRQELAARPAGGERFVFRSFAYLRCRGQRIVGRGNLAGFVIRDGAAGASATLSLNGQPATLTAAEGKLRYGR